MKYLSGDEEKEALRHITKAVEYAKNATCERAKCGSVIIKSGEIIGSGFNSPPKELESQRKCSYSKDSYHKKVTDKTCCVHAEERAIIDALKNNPDKLQNSRLYFIRLNKDNKPSTAGDPYCTICSRTALDVGIAEFVLLHEKGVCVYDTDEYNTLSFQYEQHNKTPINKSH